MDCGSLENELRWGTYRRDSRIQEARRIFLIRVIIAFLNTVMGGNNEQRRSWWCDEMEKKCGYKNLVIKIYEVFYV